MEQEIRREVGKDILNVEATPQPVQSSSLIDRVESSPTCEDDIAHFTKVTDISSVESKDGKDQNLADIMADLVKSHTLRLASMARKALLRKQKKIPLVANPEVEEKLSPSLVNPNFEEKNVTPGSPASFNPPPDDDLQINFELDLQPKQTSRYEHPFSRPETFLRRSPWDL